MKCPCGAEFEETFTNFYRIVRYNEKGELVFAVCNHGYIVVDKEIIKQE